MINMRYLAAVRAVLRTGSISGAARMLFLTQPAVTRSIQLAEEELGVKLFGRVKGRLIPTEEAAFLHPEIERIFGDILHLQDLATEVCAGHAGRIVLATVSNLSASLVTQAITEFRQQHPKVHFDIEVHSTKLVVEHVRIGQAGLGVLDLNPAMTSGINERILGESSIFCVLRRDHPLAKAGKITPADLQDIGLITFPEDTTTHALVQEAFQTAGMPCKIDMTVNHSYTACSLIDQNNLVGLIDPFHLNTDSFPRLTGVRFLPEIPLRPTVITAMGRKTTLIGEEFIEQLNRTAKAML